MVAVTKEYLKSLAFRLLVLAAAFLIGMMIYAASTDGVATLPETVGGFILTPLQSAATAVSDGVRSFFGLFGGAGLQEENERLTEELDRLRRQQTELDELRRQNATYREYLELKERNPDYRFADARVIAMDPADNYYAFTLNAGSLDGISPGDPVITPRGLVGVVYEVSAAYSKARTLLDPRAPVSVYVSRTRDNGITASQPALAEEGLLRVIRLDRTAGVSAGDYLLTLGSGTYPAGLMVGEITEVYAESDGLSLSAVVRPFADVSHLSDVFVIVDFEGAEG